MTKVLQRFANAPTIDNAWRVVRYHNQHPFAACLLSDPDKDLLQIALELTGER